ncbi:MAG TPA: HAD family phosphatase [Bacillota bacterium]|nr:HAD family phosphatase [Bacillota bacterium]
MKYKGAIFDLDGTLLDSMYVWDNAGELFLRKHGMEPAEDLAEAFRTLSLPEAAEYLCVHYKLSMMPQVAADGINAVIEDAYFNEVQPKKGVVAFLNKLKSKDIRMCIATATDRYLVEAALKRCCLYDYFSYIITCADVGKGKSNPDVFDEAQKRLELNKEECVVFEDALHAIETAKKAGYRVVAVGDTSENKNRALIIKTADIFVDSFDDMEVCL